jgi:hypothetical protein
MRQIWSIAKASISWAGIDFGGHWCHPRFWALEQTEYR